MFTGEHPWREWLIVVLILASGILVVMVIVKLLINWATRKEGEKKK